MGCFNLYSRSTSARIWSAAEMRKRHVKKQGNDAVVALFSLDFKLRISLTLYT